MSSHSGLTAASIRSTPSARCWASGLTAKARPMTGCIRASGSTTAWLTSMADLPEQRAKIAAQLAAGLSNFPRALLRASHHKGHAAANVGLVIGVAFNEDGLHPLSECRFRDRAGPRERIKDRPALRRHQPDGILHQVDWLDGRVLGADPVIGIRLGGIEESGGRSAVTARRVREFRTILAINLCFRRLAAVQRALLPRSVRERCHDLRAAIVKQIGGPATLRRSAARSRLCGKVGRSALIIPPVLRGFALPRRAAVARNPAAVDIQCPGPELGQVLGNGPDQRLARERDRLPCGLERAAPAVFDNLTVAVADVSDLVKAGAINPRGLVAYLESSIFDPARQPVIGPRAAEGGKVSARLENTQTLSRPSLAPRLKEVPSVVGAHGLWLGALAGRASVKEVAARSAPELVPALIAHPIRVARTDTGRALLPDASSPILRAARGLPTEHAVSASVGGIQGSAEAIGAVPFLPHKLKAIGRVRHDGIDGPACDLRQDRKAIPAIERRARREIFGAVNHRYSLPLEAVCVNRIGMYSGEWKHQY